jgi:AraC-like DNA-binding protein
MLSSPARPARCKPVAATPVAFVEAVLRAFEKYDVDPTMALQEAQIAPSLLHRPQACVTARQFESLCHTAMHQLDDEALGWFSRRLPWGSYGLLCRASLGAPTLGVALKRWCRHHALLTNDITLCLEIDGAQATLCVDEHADLGAAREFCLLTSLRYLHGFACWAVDSRIALRHVDFPVAAPPHAGVYPLLFPGPVRFGATRAGFSLDAHELDLPLCRDEPALRAMLQHALPLTVLQYRRDQHDRLLVQRVRELLHRRSAELVNAEAIARTLHMSVRTLHRHLRQQGASVQALKSEVRQARALELLLRTRAPLKQVARELGFRSEKSFSRAFHKWTGVPPLEWRREALMSRKCSASGRIPTGRAKDSGSQHA